MGFELFVEMTVSFLESMVAVCVTDSLTFVRIYVDLLNVAAVLLDLDVYVLAVYRPSSYFIQDDGLDHFRSDFVFVGRSSFSEISIFHL